MFSSKTMNSWLKERDKVVKSYDVQAFRAFFHKWQKRGIYDKTMTLPTDYVLELSMRKMVYHMNSATDQEKADAEKWLLEHGSRTDI